ncbi:MAG: type VII toxin-antitoxin system HepT family RNase toxin [Gammaproteobacteria bacterium]
MTDPDLIAKQLAFIESMVADLRRLARPACIETDIREERFVAHTLQMAAQAALDVASHIVSDQRLGEPQTNRELFALLEKSGWLPPEISARMQAMAGFRNLVVHGYAKVDPRMLRDIVEHRLDDLLDFVAAIRQGFQP